MYVVVWWLLGRVVSALIIFGLPKNSNDRRLAPLDLGTPLRLFSNQSTVQK
jgi:hypothetical protein